MNSFLTLQSIPAVAEAPFVFISSTVKDLEEYRRQAQEAAQTAGFYAHMMEYFPASGRGPSRDECLREVDKAELVIAIVAHRYGWVPDDNGQPDAKSITRLECEHAWNNNKVVLPFIVDSKFDWPLDRYENYRLITEQKKRGIRREVKRNEALLEEFKNKLRGNFYKEFRDAPGFRTLVVQALNDWRQGNRQASAALAPSAPGDPDTYLQDLFADTRQIRIMKLKSKQAEPYVFDMDQIYIELTTLAAPEERVSGGKMRKKGQTLEQFQRRTALERAVREPKVVIIGDPGSGKSTFLKRMAFELCRNIQGTRPKDAPPFLSPEDRRFPILIRTADFTKRLSADTSSKPHDAPGWLPYFLGMQSKDYQWGLDESFFSRKLEEGGCLVMVDGLDEAPDSRLRERVARIFEKATRFYSKCDFLVTTRPQSYEGDAVLTGFQRYRIEDLEPDEIKRFFSTLDRHFS